VAAGQSLRVAVEAATMLPAVHLSLGGIGRLAPGYRADLVLLDDMLIPRHTMRRGRWIEQPTS
jgi:N-acetylglucosamine-6-phosphate deacetylase